MSFYHNYIGTLSIPTTEKEALLDAKMLSEHHLYLNLIHYLSPAFPQVTPAQVETLSLSSYLYFRFLISLDQLIDSSRFSLDEMRLGFEFYEKAMRGLALLYPERSPFWELFSNLKKSYYATLASEKKGSRQKGEITQANFQEIAIGKSSMSFAAVFALECLQDSQANHDLLIDCIKQLHLGLQYIDDIDDFKVDFKEGQWTYPMYLTQEYLKENGLIVQDPILLHKYLYVSGIAQKNMRLAVAHFEKSADLAASAGLPLFVSFLEKQVSKCKFHLQEIENLFVKTQMKAEKSFKLEEENSLDLAIQSAHSYLEKNINASFEWTDFLTSAGQSTTWTSSYVGMMLSEVNSHHPLIKSVLKRVNSLSFNAFNDSSIADGDTTSFLLGFQQTCGIDVDPNLITGWHEFMDEDGGWVTYRNQEALRLKLEIPEEISLKGWTSSHACVTAAAAYVLAKIPSLRLDYEISCLHLATLLENKNRWASYWWTSDIYATAFAMQALSHHPDFKSICETPALWLIGEQHSSGYWPNPTTNESTAFYTALAIKSLIAYDATSFQDSIVKGVEWLLAHQTEDGSWQTNRILRIPATDVMDPSTITHWRKSSFGVNCLVDDHNRVFTTSTVLNALHHYSTASCF